MAVDFEYYDVVGRIGLTVSDGPDPDAVSDTLRPEAGAEVHFTPSQRQVFVTVGAEHEKRSVGVHIAYVDPDGYLCESVTDDGAGNLTYGDRVIKLPRLKGERVNPAVPDEVGDWTTSFHHFTYVANDGTDYATTIRDPHTGSPILLTFGATNDIGDPAVSTTEIGPGQPIVVGPRGFAAVPSNEDGNLVFTYVDEAGQPVGTPIDVGPLPTEPGPPGPDTQTFFTNSSVLTGTKAPALAKNAVPDPQMKTSGNTGTPATMTMTRITTGLPPGFSYGIQSVRTGTLSSVIGQVYAGAINGSQPLPIAVTPGDVKSFKMTADVDQASARMRLDLLFYNASWGLVTNSTGTYANVAQNVFESRVRSGVTIPAGAVWVAPTMSAATLSGNTVTGARMRVTGAIMVDGTVADPTYGDGTYEGWAWDGVPHASASRQVFLPSLTQAALATIPARVAVLEGGGGGAPLTVTRTGQAVKFDSLRGTVPVSNQGTLNGTPNGAYNLEGDLYNNASFRPGTDEATPIRTQLGTVGANHGYTCVATFANPDAKTTADLGSVWTDGTREYVLLGISGGLLVVGGSYTTTAGVVTSADVNPTTNLTHVSGATKTGAIVYTTRAATQLYPSVGRVQVGLFVDGVPVTADGTYKGKVAEVRETYEVLDYASIYETAKANIGVSYATRPVDGAVRVANTFRYRPGGICEVEVGLVELKPTTLGRCGGIQSAPISAPVRYLPGVVTADGFNWTAGVDMATYSTDTVISESELPSATSMAPAFSLDVNGTGAWAMGYLPYGRKGNEDSTSANRRAQAADADLWDMRGTDKNYPIFIHGRTAGWGRVSANAFRAILTVAEANTVLASKQSAPAAFEALDAILGLTSR